MKRFVITAIKADGLRQLAFDNNHLNTYETEKEANQRLRDTIKNNNEETVLNHVGKDLKVVAVECYAGGDSTRTIFPDGVVYKTIIYTPEQITSMREWAKECKWREDDDNSFIDDLSDMDILRAIDKNFSGGLSEAITCLTPTQIN